VTNEQSYLREEPIQGHSSLENPEEQEHWVLTRRVHTRASTRVCACKSRRGRPETHRRPSGERHGCSRRPRQRDRPWLAPRSGVPSASASHHAAARAARTGHWTHIHASRRGLPRGLVFLWCLDWDGLHRGCCPRTPRARGRLAGAPRWPPSPRGAHTKQKIARGMRPTGLLQSRNRCEHTHAHIDGTSLPPPRRPRLGLARTATRAGETRTAPARRCLDRLTSPTGCSSPARTTWRR